MISEEAGHDITAEPNYYLSFLNACIIRHILSPNTEVHQLYSV